MYRKFKFAAGAMTVCFALIPAIASATTVSVRVEGASKTLLASTNATTHTGSITKGGAPPGKCPATSAAGALDVATKGNWSGTYYSSFNDYLVKTILGETASGTPTFWSFWINYKYSSAGICSTKLHKGDQLLFAVATSSKHEFPLALRAKKKATVGHKLKVKVVWFNDGGRSTPLAGVKVSGGGLSGTTNSKGIVKLKLKKTGTLKLHATATGYIRAALLRVHVST